MSILENLFPTLGDHLSKTGQEIRDKGDQILRAIHRVGDLVENLANGDDLLRLERTITITVDGAQKVQDGNVIRVPPGWSWHLLRITTNASEAVMMGVWRGQPNSGSLIAFVGGAGTNGFGLGNVDQVPVVVIIPGGSEISATLPTVNPPTANSNHLITLWGEMRRQNETEEIR